MGAKGSKLKVDWTKADKYLEAGATGVMVAAKFGVSYKTLQRRFKERELEDFDQFDQYIQYKRSGGDADLLLKQHELALEGDKTMLVWKGKTRLGQVERKEIDIPQLAQAKQIIFTTAQSFPAPIENEADIKDENF